MKINISCQALCCTIQLLLPDLVLQEAHIAVEQGVRRRQDPYWLHPRTPLHGALHCHVGKAGKAKVGALPEVAVDIGKRGRERETDEAMSHEKQRHCQMAVLFFFFFLCQATLCFDIGPHSKLASWTCLCPPAFKEDDHLPPPCGYSCWSCIHTLTWSLWWLGESHWRWLWIPLPPGPCLWADTTPACFLSRPHNKEIIKETHTHMQADKHWYRNR